MSYGTRKAIAGGRAACEHAAADVAEAIRRFDAATTPVEFWAIMAWAKRRSSWSFRTSEDNKKLEAAWERARKRISPQGFTCPVCHKTSYHPEDVRNQYCGNCHEFRGNNG